MTYENDRDKGKRIIQTNIPELKKFQDNLHFRRARSLRKINSYMSEHKINDKISFTESVFYHNDMFKYHRGELHYFTIGYLHLFGEKNQFNSARICISETNEDLLDGFWNERNKDNPNFDKVYNWNFEYYKDNLVDYIKKEYFHRSNYEQPLTTKFIRERYAVYNWTKKIIDYLKLEKNIPHLEFVQSKENLLSIGNLNYKGKTLFEITTDYIICTRHLFRHSEEGDSHDLSKILRITRKLDNEIFEYDKKINLHIIN